MLLRLITCWAAAYPVPLNATNNAIIARTSAGVGSFLKRDKSNLLVGRGGFYPADGAGPNFRPESLRNAHLALTPQFGRQLVFPEPEEAILVRPDLMHIDVGVAG